jgi:N-acetylmuramoyl-L-alanine amidase
MRERAVARRTLLASAAGYGICTWAIGPAVAGRHAPGSRQLRPKPRLVALDPGHGGMDPGAISPNGLYEKTVTLAIARELAHRLDASGRYRALLTRGRDSFVPLRQRVARARAARAELFLSIHVDALPDRGLHGLSVYTLSERASDRETAALAVRENKDDFVSGLRLSRRPPVIGAILLDLARRQTNNQSLVLARSIVEELGRAVPLLDKPHREAGFTVLTAPDIPSALVELGCLSNPAEERLLAQHAYQRRLAEALAHAIGDYFAGAVPA